MLILAFECSNSQLAVAILRENKLLSQEIIEDGFSHSELLVVKINDILKNPSKLKTNKISTERIPQMLNPCELKFFLA